MKKRIVALLMLACLLTATLASCKKEDPKPTEDTTAADTTAEVKGGYEGSLTDLVTAIYEKAPVELRLGPTTPIDLDNADNVKYYLGLTSVDGIQEAVFSEPMMSSQAYSLCVVRAADGTDAKTLAQSIFDSVDTRKWICVEADNMAVVDSGDVVLLVMVASELGEDVCNNLCDAFSSIVGTVGSKLTK